MSKPTLPPTLLVVSQVFLPDPTSVGQHMADVAIEMARRGYRVRVYAANRGYENPAIQYLPRENIDGVEIRRLPFSSFGKKRIVLRAFGTLTFMIQSFFVALFTPRLDAIFFSTSPPLIGFVLSLAAMIRRVPVAYWAMDLNPDQLIALGRIKPTSLVARGLEWVNRFILRRATLVVALDRFMADRLHPRAPLAGKLLVMPPWPHENFIESVDPTTNPFCNRHDLLGKFVIMYSGNHSPANPLTTLLNAALYFKDDPDIRFLFVGGGSGKGEVEALIREHGLSNVLSLPYQPIAELRFSLSAADIHVVSLGDAMVGIVHPCKIYGAMTVAKPILFFGPSPSHIMDLLDQHSFGWHVPHGDVPKAVETIREIRGLPRQRLQAMGQLAQQVLRDNLSQERLCARFCDALEDKCKLARHDESGDAQRRSANSELNPTER
ncbi:MAG: glycosyl transferase group 1 [Phycisphaerales bacterium]|nr:glycosyl transferase group 1 [Phycisphaerales bacterium]